MGLPFSNSLQKQRYWQSGLISFCFYQPLLLSITSQLSLQFHGLLLLRSSILLVPLYLFQFHGVVKNSLTLAVMMMDVQVRISRVLRSEEEYPMSCGCSWLYKSMPHILALGSQYASKFQAPTSSFNTAKAARPFVRYQLDWRQWIAGQQENFCIGCTQRLVKGSIISHKASKQPSTFPSQKKANCCPSFNKPNADSSSANYQATKTSELLLVCVYLYTLSRLYGVQVPPEFSLTYSRYPCDYWITRCKRASIFSRMYR